MSGVSARRWGDLKARALSALVMLAVGALALWLGGWAFAALVLLVCGTMLWELGQMTALPGSLPALALGALGAAVLLAVMQIGGALATGLLLVPALAGVVAPRRDRAVFLAYALLVMLTGYGLITLRAGHGVAVILWLLAVVIVSDVMGYFAGRLIGGPKFWPKVSPKKTWSGTVAGWLGAVVVGLGFMLAGQGGAALLWLSPLVAFAGQLGDIAESAIKRRAGAKDSSQLIPGHGGAMDRFDALAGAVVLVVALAHLVPLPVGMP
ncbi:phosphatidate cytidylyltransferase [Gemmobacter aquatilis]|uniref:Phosphatidate cytidylyltransferase n=1 Tax=Gemmobacter aquatilis TaxID=933059 RepID=A0A1H8C4D6_9RHOB|nr:phosphatidate cytidylyltransferase [Gemmobacter aquatilis]SEM89945.1 phosphatidate cytidylyltransferase [Gemmobacter aquatilis]